MDFERIAKNLENRGFKASCFATAKEACSYVKSQVKDSVVAIGGSKTVEAMGLYEELSENNKVYWHWKGDEIGPEEQFSDIYLSSVNAMSEGGDLILIDGFGNRVGGVVYGHKKVFFLVGKNKIAESFEAAMARARNVAAPKNAARFEKPTPCFMSENKKCYDCMSPDRICRAFLTLTNPTTGNGAMEVVLIDEELGF